MREQLPLHCKGNNVYVIKLATGACTAINYYTATSHPNIVTATGWYKEPRQSTMA